MPKLNAVALVSGGKDSMFSILHCQANGHNVVALANLHPSLDLTDDLQEDTNSFMYQTIGHKIIPLYKDVLGLPLYRQAIIGAAINQNKSYAVPGDLDSTAQDETESLLPLLKRVISAHPEVNAVSTGAILSDYQRIRVESVALRLGLTPLSYLWQYPSLSLHSQTALLEDMAAVRQDSRIIKVASGGLDESFLWQNVAEAQTINRLMKASERFGSVGDGAALGEGGEYETLAIEGPSPLWKGRILIEEAGRITIPGEAGTAFLRITNARVVKKECQCCDESLALRTPGLLDDRFRAILADCPKPDATPMAQKTAHAQASQGVIETWQFESNGRTLSIRKCVGSGADAATQMHSAMERLSQTLTECGHSLSDMAFTAISLRDISDFACVNAVYGPYFKAPNPPARVTIARGDLPAPDCKVVLSVISVRLIGSSRSRGLHVQSRSYWAPANIGPYSQAIAVPLLQEHEATHSPELVYVAGQIPLCPASMEIIKADGLGEQDAFEMQAVLSLQHLHRIGEVMRVRHWAIGVCFVMAETTEELSERSAMTHAVWESFHNQPPADTLSEEPDDDFDVWDARNRGGFNINQHTQPRRQAQHLTTTSGNVVPSLYVVKVQGMPRGADIEWACLGLTASEAADHDTIKEALDRYLEVLGVSTSQAST